MKKREFRILLTENCNANCKNCFNSQYREDHHICIEDLEKVFKYLSLNGVEKLKIMGGEPTVHPDFFSAVELAQQYFEKIIIFTNALNDNISLITPREQDCIIYNFNFITTEFDINKLLLNKPGIRAFEVQVNYDTDIDDYKRKLYTIKRKMNKKKKVNIYLTLDCTEKIFLHRDEIINKWNELTEFINVELGVDTFQDHIIPKCFYENTNMNIKKISNMCNVLCSGLIDSSLNIRYCNQHPVVLGKLDMTKDFNSVLSLLEKEYEEKMKIRKKLKCKNCKNYLISCNGGCFENA